MGTNRPAVSVRQRQYTAVLLRLERLYVTVALVVFAGAFIPIIQMARGQSLDISRGDRLMQMIILSIFLLAASIAVLDLRRSLRTAVGAPLTLLLVGLAVASTLWSEMPALTLRRSLALAGTTVFGIYLVTRFDSRTRLHLLASALGITLVGCLLVAVLLPEYGTTGGSVHTPWRGVFTDKNTFGRMMVLSTAVFLVMSPSAGRRGWLLWLLAGASAYLALHADSATALVILTSVILLLPFYISLRLHYSRLIPIVIWAILIATVGALLTIARSEEILTHLGRDATLTGRTQLWETVFVFIKDRFWLGYGYNAFWTGWSGLAGDVWAALSWEPPHSHNGFLDLWLDLGLVGLCLCLFDIVLSLQRTIRAAAAPQGAVDLWGLVFWTILLLSNVSESILLRQNSLFWVLYVATVAGARRARQPLGSLVPSNAPPRSPVESESPVTGALNAPPANVAALSLAMRWRLKRQVRDRAPDVQ